MQTNLVYGNDASLNLRPRSRHEQNINQRARSKDVRSKTMTGCFRSSDKKDSSLSDIKQNKLDVFRGNSSNPAHFKLFMRKYDQMVSDDINKLKKPKDAELFQGMNQNHSVGNAGNTLNAI